MCTCGRPMVLVGTSGKRRKRGAVALKGPPPPATQPPPHCRDVAGCSEGCEILKSHLTFQIIFKVSLLRQENIPCLGLLA